MPLFWAERSIAVSIMLSTRQPFQLVLLQYTKNKEAMDHRYEYTTIFPSGWTVSLGVELVDRVAAGSNPCTHDVSCQGSFPSNLTNAGLCGAATIVHLYNPSLVRLRALGSYIWVLGRRCLILKSPSNS